MLDSYVMSLAKTIKDKKDELRKSNLICLDVNLSKKETECLDNIKVDREFKQFNHYGVADKELKEYLQEYLNQIGNNTESNIGCVAGLIVRIHHGMIGGFDEVSAWTMVRVIMPTEDFNIQRWHADGSYFKSSKKVYKLVMSLLGPQTLFGRINNLEKYKSLTKESGKNVQDNILDNNNPNKFKEEDLRIRKELLKIVEPIKSCEKRNAGIYLVGDDNAVVHSEPKIDTPRLFISVLPGSKEQINEWRDRNNKD